MKALVMKKEFWDILKKNITNELQKNEIIVKFKKTKKCKT